MPSRHRWAVSFARIPEEKYQIPRKIFQEDVHGELRTGRARSEDGVTEDVRSMLGIPDWTPKQV